MMMNVNGTRQKGHWRKTCWDCVKKIMKSLGLFREDTQSRIMEKIGWLVDRLVFNGTFSRNRLYHAIEV